MADELTTRELLALSRGEDLEQIRQQHCIDARVREHSKQFHELPPEQWTSKPIKWDLSSVNHRFSLDGVSQHEFENNYPSGLLVGQVDFESFDLVISSYCRKAKDELWKVGNNEKLARVIAHVDMGYELTPIFIQPDESNKASILLVGGNHRYAFCKGRQESKIPFLCESKYKDELSRRLKIDWN